MLKGRRRTQPPLHEPAAPSHPPASMHSMYLLFKSRHSLERMMGNPGHVKATCSPPFVPCLASFFLCVHAEWDWQTAVLQKHFESYDRPSRVHHPMFVWVKCIRDLCKQTESLQTSPASWMLADAAACCRFPDVGSIKVSLKKKKSFF